MAKLIIITNKLNVFDTHVLNDVVVSFRDEIKAKTVQYEKDNITMSFINCNEATSAAHVIAKLTDIPITMEIKDCSYALEEIKIRQIAANLQILFEGNVEKITHYLLSSDNDINAILEDTENGIEAMVSDAENKAEEYPQ